MRCSIEENAIEGIREKIASGDQDAFRQLFNFYCKKLITFSLSIVKSGEAAREIVDEVFIKIWRNRAQLTEIEHLRVYLYTAVKNTSLNYLSARAQQNITEPFDFFTVEPVDDYSPERKMINAEMIRKINASIESLPPRCRMVFKLVREDGLSYKEVGEILNISPKTVDAQMVIAVRHISEQMKMDLDGIARKKSGKK